MPSPRKSLEFLSFSKVNLLLGCIVLGLKQKRLSGVRRSGLLKLRDIYLRHRESVWPEKCLAEAKGKKKSKGLKG